MASSSRSTSRSARSRTSQAASDNSLDVTQVAEGGGIPEGTGARTNRRRTTASASDTSNFTGAVSHASGGASTAAERRDNPGRDPLQEADPWQTGRVAQNNARPAQRKLDSCRLRTSSASTVNHLALLGSIVIADLRRAAVEIKFETINERFDWRLPEGSDWNLICSVDLAQTATCSQDEAGTEQ